MTRIAAMDAHLQPVADSNVVYSVHVYEPYGFTCWESWVVPQPVSYPGVIAGRRWDRAALEEAVRPIIAFQHRYGVRIYIGEFSAVRWSGDGGNRYLSDMIDIFRSTIGCGHTMHSARPTSGTRKGTTSAKATRPGIRRHPGGSC